MSGDVATKQSATVQQPMSSPVLDSSNADLTPSNPAINSTSKKVSKCGESSTGKALSSDSQSSFAGEATSGTVAKVVERRKSDLTLTIKCSQAKNSDKDKDESSDDDDDNDDEDDDDDSEDSSSMSSSSNSEDEMSCTTKPLTLSTIVARKSRTKFPTTTAKTVIKKQHQQSTESDSSPVSSDSDARRNAPRPSSSSVSAAATRAAAAAGGGGGQTPSKVTKRKRSVNSQSPSRKRRRSSLNSKVGCKSALVQLNQRICSVFVYMFTWV